MNYYELKRKTFIEKVVEECLPNQENFLYGYADLKDLVSSKYASNPYVIIIGKKLEDKIVNKIASSPTLEYSNHYLAINDELSNIANQIASQLKKKSIETLIIPPTVSSDWICKQIKGECRIRYDFSHKLAATRAGLGWIGKTDLLITFKFGPRVRLISILIDEPLHPNSEPVTKSQCGRCNLCVNACPANAANGVSWTALIDRDEFFDPLKCWEYSKSISKKMKFEEGNKSVCGKCVSVCPYGKK